MDTLFYYLLEVTSQKGIVYKEDGSKWYWICFWVLNTFFMRRKLDYCEMLDLRRKVDFLKGDNLRYEKKLANVLKAYAGVAPAESSLTCRYGRAKCR